MNTTLDPHTRCVDGLPALLDGSLDAAEAGWLIAHTCACDRCRDELELARRLRAHFEREWSDVAPLLDADHEEAQFERLWTRVAASEPAVPAPLRPRRVRWTTALPALAATLLLGTGIAWQQKAEVPSFRTLANPPLSCRALKIEVREVTPALQQVLKATGARVIAGSRLDGSYTVAAPNPAETLRQLRTLPTVERAEPTGC
jgi:hypothetical protein